MRGNADANAGVYADNKDTYLNKDTYQRYNKVVAECVCHRERERGKTLSNHHCICVLYVCMYVRVYALCVCVFVCV